MAELPISIAAERAHELVECWERDGQDVPGAFREQGFLSMSCTNGLMVG